MAAEKIKLNPDGAAEIAEKIDYDSGYASKEVTMSSGVTARTLVLDVRAYCI